MQGNVRSRVIFGVVCLSTAVGILLYWAMFMDVLPRVMRPEAFSILPLVSGVVGALSCALLYFAVVNLASPLKRGPKSRSGIVLVREGKIVYAKSISSSQVVTRSSATLNKEAKPRTGRTWTFAFVFGLLGCYVTAVFLFGTLTPFMAVATRSMKPAYNPGDLILVKAANGIKVGDVIVFNVPSPYDKKVPSPIVHRVVDIQKLDGLMFFKTKGDNNPEVDPWIVPTANVIGKVVYSIPLFGYLMLYLRNVYVLLTVIAALTIWTLYPYFRR